ncbi:hypothetical protein HMPREF2902_02775 [Actinomyces sp. HMSC035G02]|nr:hypothetical protein HMPREF2902_02775 [Actinomyces sp. HMSC035G02]
MQMASVPSNFRLTDTMNWSTLLLNCVIGRKFKRITWSVRNMYFSWSWISFKLMHMSRLFHLFLMLLNINLFRTRFILGSIA